MEKIDRTSLGKIAVAGGASVAIAVQSTTIVIKQSSGGNPIPPLSLFVAFR